MTANLRDRVGAKTGATAAPGKEVAKTSLNDQIRQMLPQFEMAMPKGFEAQQLIRDAFTLMRGNPKLAECTPESVLGGLMTFAQLGLRPGVMGQGWLIPFTPREKVNGQWRNGQPAAQIVIGYLGYVELIHRSGAIRKITGRAVHQNDLFRVSYGMNETLEHELPERGKDRGPITDYYAIIHLQDGDPTFWTMTVEECLEWRAHFAMSTHKERGQVVRDVDGNTTGSGPWYDMEGPPGGSGFDQMSIKTCFLRAKRFVPKSTDRLLTAAAEVDGAVRMSYNSVDDVDEMLNAEHPDPNVIDGDVIDGDAASTAPPVHDVGPKPGAAPADLRTEFPQIPGRGTDEPATGPQQNALTSIMRTGGVTEEVQQLAVLARLVGRAPVTRIEQLTKREAGAIMDLTKEWQSSGTFADQVAAIVAALPAPAPVETVEEAGKLPARGTKAWHDARHPRVNDTGKTVARVDVDLDGECGICEMAG